MIPQGVLDFISSPEFRKLYENWIGGPERNELREILKERFSETTGEPKDSPLVTKLLIFFGGMYDGVILSELIEDQFSV